VRNLLPSLVQSTKFHSWSILAPTFIMFRPRTTTSTIQSKEVSSSSDARSRPKNYRIFHNNRTEELPLLTIVKQHANISTCSKCFMWFVKELHFMTDSTNEIRIPVLQNMVVLYRNLFEEWRDGRPYEGHDDHMYLLHHHCLTQVNQYVLDNRLDFPFNFAKLFAAFYTKLLETFLECESGNHRSADLLFER